MALRGDTWRAIKCEVQEVHVCMIATLVSTADVDVLVDVQESLLLLQSVTEILKSQIMYSLVPQWH